MITIVAKNLVKQEKIQEFKMVAEKLIIESRKEKGNISYNLYEDSNNHNILTFIEGWESEEVIKLHNSSKHFTTIVPKLGEFEESKPEINLYKIVL